MVTPALYVLSTDPARRPIAFVAGGEACGHESPNWIDNWNAYCPECGAWGTDRREGGVDWVPPRRAR